MSGPQPLTANSAALRSTWPRGRARSGAGRTLGPVLFALVVWSVLSLVLARAFLLGRDGHPTPWAGVAVAFLAVEAVLIVQSAFKIAAWFRFGRLEVVLDPFPGSLGGHVGGGITLPVRVSRPEEIRITLLCIRTDLQRANARRTSTGGERWDTVVWSEEVHPRVEPMRDGTHLRFTFQVPAGLPPTELRLRSSSVSQSYHNWAVRIEAVLPGLDLDRSFAVPVVETPEPVLAHYPVEGSAVDPSTVILPRSMVRVTRMANGLRLYYPATRGRAVGISALFFAFLLGAFAFPFAGGGALRGEDWGAMLTGFARLWGGAALLVAVLLGIAGLYFLLNTLTVTLKDGEIVATRRLLGTSRVHRVPVDDIDQLQLAIRVQQGQGASATVRYALKALTKSGHGVVLGDGLRGSEVAKRVAGLIHEATDAPVITKTGR